ncbi:MAG: sel1 repeat family protein [Candidatus Riflebacteria bacterium]|nr:sel1 repeat family protein [Candidatus Riflebacteria bacterium]
MKKFYITVCVIILLILGTIMAIYLSNPLVKKKKMGPLGFLTVCTKTLTKDASSLKQIGEFSYKFRDTDKDLETYGEYLLAKAANLGDKEAMGRLGGIRTFYKNDEKKGIPLLTKAGELGYSKSNYLLGLYYISKEEDDKGLELLKKAGEQGDKESEKLYKKMNGAIDYDKINKLFEEAKKEAIKTVDAEMDFAGF